jgi:hypothetical protein
MAAGGFISFEILTCFSAYFKAMALDLLMWTKQLKKILGW